MLILSRKDFGSIFFQKYTNNKNTQVKISHILKNMSTFVRAVADNSDYNPINEDI
jgi:hypothetical protein